ncbi:L-aspartate oxidase [Tessaracoccus caeni]|uniref:L-aspartate oxidase n=1 Tax=Tessaracoccus caeni TaxID=3031239 RepID=UPI0023DB961E|nr:L-aspartate oxidase [Tessaracoccus caeni]MDF1487184.1 L-aspartate oxidase [Tessaracoccus caeni]
MNTTRTELVIDGPVIVGAGLAGLSCAIELAPTPCLVVTAGRLGVGTSTGWAQGGMAAAIGPDDSPDLHAADTLAAGAGLCDETVVGRIIAAAPETVEWLTQLGARWDRNDDGSLKLGLEGAHSRRRIVHAQGDRTGAELLRTVIEAARRLPSVSVWEQSVARRIVVEGGRATGIDLDTPDGPVRVRATAVVLATGGVGGLFTHTTNPLSSRGQGLALAYRAGAALRDLEMVQFHPTALDVALDPLPLISEAVRGEGAILVNELGERVLEDPLSARDVVSRAEWAQLQAGHTVFLDARTSPGERFAQVFPSIHATALAAGLDPTKDLLPVTPAAHYHMGGVLVDADGQSTVPGLFAAGEVASTGLHGANRLASNSLLEAVVCGRGIARRLRRTSLTIAIAPLGERNWQRAAHARPDDRSRTSPLHDGARRVDLEADEPQEHMNGETQPQANIPWCPTDPRLDEIRRIVTAGAGVLRNADGLRRALDELTPYLDDDAGLVGYLLAHAALIRAESRGGHTRTDFPETTAPQHTVVSTTRMEGRAA